MSDIASCAPDGWCIFLRAALRQSAAGSPESYASLAKDVGLLVKILRNPAEQPDELKFRKIKLSNATIGRVLSHPGARDVLAACGFVETSEGECLELIEVDRALLLRTSQEVEAVQYELQELDWLYVNRAATASPIPGRPSEPWSADGAPAAMAHTCVTTLLKLGTEAAAKGPWLARLSHMLFAPEMVECRRLVRERASVLIMALRAIVLELIRMLEMGALSTALQCLAFLWPAGAHDTLAARLEFCSSCLAAALSPADAFDESPPLELKLRLVRGEIVPRL
jgi:hypothetical protein